MAGLEDAAEREEAVLTDPAPDMARGSLQLGVTGRRKGGRAGVRDAQRHSLATEPCSSLVSKLSSAEKGGGKISTYSCTGSRGRRGAEPPSHQHQVNCLGRLSTSGGSHP